MKIVGFDDFEEAMILFAEYDPYLIDAKRINIRKIINCQKVYLFLNDMA